MTGAAGGQRVALDVATTLAAALGLGLFLEVLRLWFPAVAFIYGRAGSTDPLQLGLFALAPFLLAFLAAPLIRRRGARDTMLAAGGVLVAARLVVQVADGGQLQLWSATAAALAGLVLVAAAAAGGLARGPLAVGLAGGLAVDAAVEIALTGSSLDWTAGRSAELPAVVAGWVLLLLLLAAFGYALVRSQPAGTVLITRAWPWLLLGPVLALHLVLGGLQPPLVAATTARVVGGSSARLVAGGTALIVAAAYLLSVRYAAEARPRRGRAWGPPLLLVVGAGGAIGLQGEPALLGACIVLILALGVAAAIIPTTAGTSTPARHATAAAGGTFLLFLVAFPYYASYDLPMGVGNRTFLILAGLGLGLGLFLAGRRGTGVPAAAPPGPRATAVAVVVVALVLGATVALRTSIPTAPGGDGYPVRVALANLHMGFDTEGRYVGAVQGLALGAVDPDVVVLNEVDRGWALNGGQDVLADVARGLDMPYVFAPAADDVWGNAILSRYPVLGTGQEILPDSGGYMVRSAVWVVLDLGGGRELGVVGTHLHHRGEDASIRRPQAARVAEIAAALSTAGRPVVLAGDLNSGPRSPDLAPIEARFRHAAGPSVPRTYPSTGPDRAIDHVYLTPDLHAVSYEAFPVPDLSDHAWLVVTIEPAVG
ncbi:MAG TPA: endonuclease/exonuclease/phosphatase family protein [Nitriliruptorales bacterium]